MGIEPMMEVLQTSALPLGYVARIPRPGSREFGSRTPRGRGGEEKKRMERKTRLELATPSLARTCSTTELLPPDVLSRRSREMVPRMRLELIRP